VRRQAVSIALAVLILLSACLLNVVVQQYAREHGYCVQICPLPSPTP